MNNLKKRIKSYLRNALMVYRYKREITQEEMAKLLHISLRSCSDLECGRYCFSTLTLILFLCLLSEEQILEIARSLKAFVKDAEEKEVT